MMAADARYAVRALFSRPAITIAALATLRSAWARRREFTVVDAACCACCPIRTRTASSPSAPIS